MMLKKEKMKEIHFFSGLTSGPPHEILNNIFFPRESPFGRQLLMMISFLKHSNANRQHQQNSEFHTLAGVLADEI